MIYFMFVDELSPEDIRFLKFEDLIMKNNQASIKVYRTKNKKFQKMHIFKYLFNKIMKYEKDFIKKGNDIWQTDYVTKSKLSAILCLRIRRLLL